MSEQLEQMMADYGMTAVTPEQLADRAAFAEIVGEDPRSYKRAVEHQQTRTHAPVRVTRGWSLTSFAEQLDRLDDES